MKKNNKKHEKITPKEKIFLMKMSYMFLKSGYHTDYNKRKDNITLATTPNALKMVYKELYKLFYDKKGIE